MAATTPPAAVIFGCAGAHLTDAEAKLFADADPFGAILFQRNCETPDGVRALIAALRAATRTDLPIFIDQEGGSVARLGPPHWPVFPAAATFGKMAAIDPEKGAVAAARNARQIAELLKSLGITVNCAPVLDLARADTTDAIGDRAFSGDPEIVTVLGRAVCQATLAGGVLPVIKHIPGHGRATQDSHLVLPTVGADTASLRATDFVPFAGLADMPLAMTAHILYTALDDIRPATQSPAICQNLIRDELGFDGVLISDDISMGALGGSVEERAALAWGAGCDLVLHCNGRLDELRALTAAAPRMDTAAMERWQRAEILLA